jgi:NAD(P)-dependent dehydrogenase (short-subunit alcohol dehydrogenase family)
MQSSKVCAVVGVGPGLGASIARRFAREGYAVALMARRIEALTDIERPIAAAGNRAKSFAIDATRADSVKAAFAGVRADLGVPDVLVYNAGAFRMGGVLEVPPEEFEASWRANCFGALLTVREVLPSMLERHRGTILLTGATASLRGAARFSCLAVGKFGLRALAQSLARELGPEGVHVAHVVIDGQIDTPRVRSMLPGRAADSFLAPDAIADTYWALHAQDATTWTFELDLRPKSERF